MTFLEMFMNTASRDAESPKSFFYWSALCAISAVVKRNVWIQRPNFKTYPNIFVLFVADSGLRKGVPIALAKDLVHQVNNTRVISGRSSVPGILQYLGTSYTIQGKDGQPDIVMDKAHGFIAASEFSSSIVRDPDALTTLTDLYDSCYNEFYEDRLRSANGRLIEPSITLLGGTNPAHFDDYISAAATEGGFVARTIIVYEQEKACINPAIRPVKDEFKYDSKPLAAMLKAISKVQGQMAWADEEAIEAYEKWYIDYEENRIGKQKDRTGTDNRMGENVLKVATLVSLSRKPDLFLTKEDIEHAITVCYKPLQAVKKVTAGQSNAQTPPYAKIVLKTLLEAPEFSMSRSKILNANYGKLYAEDLDRVMNTFIEAGAATENRKGAEIVYSLTPAIINQLVG